MTTSTARSTPTTKLIGVAADEGTSAHDRAHEDLCEGWCEKVVGQDPPVPVLTARHRAIIGSLPIGIAVLDADGGLVEANRSFWQLLGIAPGLADGGRIQQVLVSPISEAARTPDRDLCSLHDVRPGDMPVRLRLDGPSRAAVVAWSTALPGGARALHIQGVGAPEVALSGLQTGALHSVDDLTGLPDAEALQPALEGLVAAGGGALVKADLDRFLNLNSTMGEEVGDAVIRAAAAALSTVAPAGCMLARTGADEFGLVLPDADLDAARRVGEVMVLAVRNAAMLGGAKTPRITASVGVAPVSRSAPADVASLMMLADQAIGDARALGGNRVVVLNATDAPAGRIAEHRSWLGRLGEMNAALRAWMQPIVPLAVDDGVARYELLVRWEDEDGQVRTPGEFLDIAEAAGVIERIDRWMIRRAAMQALAATTPVQVTVNVAVSTLQTPDFTAWLYRTLRGVPQGSVMIEVTESEALGSPTTLRDAITAVKNAGCQVAVDDFGSGFATFRHLTALHVDVLKLDGAFVTDMATNPIHHKIVATMAALTEDLGIPMIAECVEDGRTADMLRELGVAWGQGYHFARPVPLPPMTATPTDDLMRILG